MRQLILSDRAGFTTSYGIIARNFGTELARRGEEVAFGSFQEMSGSFYWEIPGTGKRVPLFGVGQQANIKQAMEEFRPERIVHIRDMIAHKAQYHQTPYSIKPNAQGVPVWGWAPVQSEEYPWEHVDAAIREYDKTLLFTQSGVESMGNHGMPRERMVALMPGVDEAYANPDVPPIDPVGGLLARKGIKLVVSIGEPRTYRKMFPSLMAGYSLIAARVDLDFYLHTLAQGGHYNLVEHANQLGVSGHWIVPKEYVMEGGMPATRLARYYRQAAAYVAVGTGEGLNMPLMEAASMGVPIVYPAFPNNVEVASDLPSSLRFPVKTHRFPLPNYWESHMDVEDLARQLEAAVNTPPDLEAGRRYYEAHSWAKTVDRYLAL